MSNGITTIEQAQATLAPKTTQFDTLAKDMRVRSPVSYVQAGEHRKGIESLIREIEATRKSLKEPILESGRRLDTVFNGMKKPLIAARGVIDQKLSKYRREEQEKADKKRAEEERKQRELDNRRREAILAAAREQGDSEEEIESTEEEFFEAPMVTPTPTPSRIPKVEGLSATIRWSGEVTDINALVHAVAEGKAPIDLLQINTAELNRLAKALRSTMNVPGVRAVSTESFTQRS